MHHELIESRLRTSQQSLNKTPSVFIHSGCFYCLPPCLVCSCQIKEIWKDCLEISVCLLHPINKIAGSNQTVTLSGAWSQRRDSLCSFKCKNKKKELILSTGFSSKWPQARTPRQDPCHTKVNIKSNNWICFLSRRHQGADNKGRVMEDLCISGPQWD